MATTESNFLRGVPAPSPDPIVPFHESLARVAVDLESRSDDELATAGRGDPDPALREQALVTLLQRRGEQSLPVIEKALAGDPDTDLRINLLWGLQECGGPVAQELALARTTDPDARVQEWARVLCWEMGWTDEDFRRATRATFRHGRTFDQTIYLHIMCDLFIRLDPGNRLWGHMRLSPQMLARVYGQALACPITKTREHELVIAKTLRGLHEDGSEHYESFLFRGFTERTSRLTGNFYFEAHTPRPFYLSGRADDRSEGVLRDITIPFARQGQWFLNENLALDGDCAIEYVRGLFQGWAFVNLDRIQRSGGEVLFPGNSVLATLHHPRVGPLTNTFFSGRFKGKVVDWDGDGILDVNALPAHATAAGEVDSDMDGVPDVPGMFVCSHPLVDG